jgi:cell division protein FtsZ
MEKSATASMPIEARSADEAEDIPEIITAVGTGEAFMPPPAIDPKRTAEPGKRPDPFREADLINGGTTSPRRRKGPSLFQRMTGAAKASKKQAEQGASTDVPVEPAAPAEPSIEPPKVETPKFESPKTETPPTPRQPRLEDVTPSAAPQATQSEEDLLDIPAFLRRQAN